MISKRMPPRYPFVLLPLFLITSYYFYQINMYMISEIYILLYLFFLLSYIFARHWIIPFIFNFLPGLIPWLMTNQLAVLANQNPGVDVGEFPHSIGFRYTRRGLSGRRVGGSRLLVGGNTWALFSRRVYIWYRKYYHEIQIIPK